MEHQSEFDSLLGKRVWKAYRNHDEGWEDRDIIILEFTDGTKAKIKSSYGSYSDVSMHDEYPALVSISIL